MEQNAPSSATQFYANQGDNQDAPISQQDMPQMPQKTTGKCSCGIHLPTVTQASSATKPTGQCLCGRKLEDDFPISEASLPQMGSKSSAGQCTCGGKVEKEYAISEAARLQTPQTPKNTSGQCLCGQKLLDDFPISEASLPQMSSKPNASQCVCGRQIEDDLHLSEASLPHMPKSTSGKCTCGRHVEIDTPKSEPDATQYELPTLLTASVGVEETPPIMQQPEVPAQTRKQCTCGRAIAAPQNFPLNIKQEIPDEQFAEQSQQSVPTKSPRDYESCPCQKSALNAASQQSALRAQSQSPSRTLRSCSCGQKFQRDMSQSPSRAIQCPFQKVSQPQSQALPSESVFKSLQTITGRSEADFVPRSGQQIPLIPMNLHYPSSLPKCSCGGDVMDYSSRAMTPATLTTDTSASTNPATTRIPTDITGIAEEEYYSLSSSEKDDVCPCPAVNQNSSIYRTPESMDGHPIERGRSEGRSQIQKREKRARSESAARNVIILQLLHEVVHLINEEDSVSDSTSNAPVKQKIRNIGACFNDDSRPDVGAFSSRTNLSSIKITFMPSGGDACARQCIDASESQQNAMNMLPPTQSFEMNCPPVGSQCCNVFISPNLNKYPSCPLPSGHPGMVANYAHVGIEAQSFLNWHPGSETINYAMEELQNHTNMICEPDIVMDEYGNPMLSSTNNPNVCSPNNDEGADECPPDCSCPIHDRPMGDDTETGLDGEQQPNGTTMMTPSVVRKLKQLTATPVEVRTEVAPLYAFASENNCEEEEYECDYEDEHCLYEMARRKEQKNQSDCDCCHCRAMREVRDARDMPCKAIASPQQALENGGNCNDLKFFIDSIIMDLDAMEHARRNKMNQKHQPKKNAICGRESFPVTITDVTELGSSSLYVKWCIHDCYGIGGYEIYVDGHLTNRYFHCNHEAAVICDVCVTDPHKIVLLAQPKVNDNYEEMCSVQKENKSDINKSLAAKKQNGRTDFSQAGSRNGKDPNAVWTPSIYYYDPVVCKSAPANPMCSCVK